MIDAKITVAEKNAGKRIEILAAETFPEISRTRWQRHGEFFLKKVEKKGKNKIAAGEIWTVKFCPPAELEKKLAPWNFELKILAEEKNWIAIEKPIGISVHPSASENSDETIVNALVAQFPEIGKNFDDAERPGIVHRLDKPTSGILLVAKTPEAHAALQKNWKKVEKTYVAIVCGQPPKSGKIEAGISRDKKDRQKMAVSSSSRAKSAESFFERLKTDTTENLSLIEVKIPTGRTHQIRVHFSAIGFPILGDEKYGGKKADRVFLHAWKLKFPDPDSAKTLEIESPIPTEFEIV
ncbi:RluA family pseudouridine synthase [bacterium]|jgi:23S rRNA pseudouridine1911/1915/1917 synthase|nr:RluA family pseudouridine synthase [bacterium]MBT6996532.1 RluA family pseudouridine synthase [bacterium]MBT7772858.1 RluA family pseudouridine synthase [bacterium]